MFQRFETFCGLPFLVSDDACACHQLIFCYKQVVRMSNWYLGGTDWSASCRRAINFIVKVEERDVFYQPCLQANINLQITNSATLDNIVTSKRNCACLLNPLSILFTQDRNFGNYKRTIRGRRLYDFENILRRGRYLAVRDLWVSLYNG